MPAIVATGPASSLARARPTTVADLLAPAATWTAGPFARAVRQTFAPRPAALADALDRPGARALAPRDPKRRAAYAGDPWAYFADILGWRLVPDQEEALGLIERADRVLLPSGNNLGKTFLVSGYAVYRLDAVAALPDEDNGLAEQGARIILPGPDHDTIFATIFAEMLTHAARAELRGHLMPGERSERSVLWRVRPKWEVEAMSPPKKVGQQVAHTASGRHHRNLVVCIEEGQGVDESLWKASEGMASSAGNKIVSSFNPTEPIGPAYQRAQAGAYHVLHLDAFRHPNVRERRPVVPDAVAPAVIDARVRTDCRDRGPAAGPGAVIPEAEHGDFVYALPPLGEPLTPGARPDGVLGDIAGSPRVYRPSGAFMAQVRGQWPTGSDGGLFVPSLLDAAVQRWRERPDPDLRTVIPDRVGGDPARMGEDEPCAAPAWGPTAAELLRRYADAELAGPLAVAELRQRARVRVGLIRVLPKGDGPDVALALATTFPGAPFVLDVGSVGASPVDHLSRVLRRDVTPVSFGAAPLEPLPGEPWSENLRTQLYVRAALLVARGLADVPDDPLLREELLAHRVSPAYRTALVTDRHGRRVKQRVPSVALLAKDEVKKLIGRSPDRADAFVLSLHHDPTPARRRGPVVLSESYLSL